MRFHFARFFFYKKKKNLFASRYNKTNNIRRKPLIFLFSFYFSFQFNCRFDDDDHRNPAKGGSQSARYGRRAAVSLGGSPRKEFEPSSPFNAVWDPGRRGSTSEAHFSDEKARQRTAESLYETPIGGSVDIPSAREKMAMDPVQLMLQREGDLIERALQESWDSLRFFNQKHKGRLSNVARHPEGGQRKDSRLYSV